MRSEDARSCNRRCRTAKPCAQICSFSSVGIRHFCAHCCCVAPVLHLIAIRFEASCLVSCGSFGIYIATFEGFSSNSDLGRFAVLRDVGYERVLLDPWRSCGDAVVVSSMWSPCDNFRVHHCIEFALPWFTDCWITRYDIMLRSLQLPRLQVMLWIACMQLHADYDWLYGIVLLFGAYVRR